jgi:hypothetical protein
MVTMHLSKHGGARMLYPDAGPEPPALQVFHDAIETVFQPSTTDSGLRIHAEKADPGRQCQQPQQVTDTDLLQLSRTDTAIWTYVLLLYMRTVLLHLSKQSIVDVATAILGFARLQVLYRCCTECARVPLPLIVPVYCVLSEGMH